MPGLWPPSVSGYRWRDIKSFSIPQDLFIRWAEDQLDQPTLSEAIRRLVELGLTVRTRRKRTSHDRSDEADVMASDQLDRLADLGATSEEQATRKRHLLKGPEEFREARVDRPKKR